MARHSLESLRGLFEIANFIAERDRSSANAERSLQRINAYINRLEAPFAPGSDRQDIGTGVRVVAVHSYLIFI